VAAPDTSILRERFAGLISEATERDLAIRGWGFSTFALLTECLAGLGEGQAETDELFPFLKANALACERTLQSSGANPGEVAHCLIAIEAARRQAQRIGVDLRSQARWEKALQPHGSFDRGAASLENCLAGDSPFPPGSSSFESLFDLKLTPDGLVRDASGNPSLLLSGIAMSRLADSLFSERDGALQVLPDIPLDGSWTLSAQNVSVPGGFTLRTITMRKGLIDSCLIRSNRGGTCRLKTPTGWSSARVLNVGNPQTAVELEGGEVLTFDTQAGDEFLIGPIW
jgi:hypothetical protein